MKAPNREIGYKKGSKYGSDDAAAVSTINKEPAISRSQAVYNWVKSHKYIKVSGICRSADVDVSLFARYMEEGKDLKPDVLEAFERILADYGFVVDLGEEKSKQ